MNQQSASQALWRIAETDDTREVESILASGAEIDASNAGGMTALMRAAAKGRKRMVLALLDHGADPNRARNDKFTALMLAAFFGHQEIVKMLVEHGAHTDATTRFGTSAQMWASGRTFKDLAKYLENPVSKEAVVHETRWAAPKQRESIPVIDHKPIPEAPWMPLERSVEKEESSPAHVVETYDDQPEAHKASKHFAPVSLLISEFPVLNRKPVVYGLATVFMVVVVVAGFSLRGKQIFTEVTSQSKPAVAVDRGAVAARRNVPKVPLGIELKTQVVANTSAPDHVSQTIEEKKITPADTNIEKLLLASNPSKKQNSSKTPIASRSFDSGDLSSENQNAVTKVNQPLSAPDLNPSLPDPDHNPRDTHSRESLAAAASTEKPRPPVSRDPPPRVKAPDPLSIQMISPSKSSTRTGKVIQWP